MSDTYHKRQQPNDGIHSPYAWKFLTEQTRLDFLPYEGMPLFASELTSSDLYRVALQLSDMTTWILTAISPVTWAAQGSSTTVSGSFTGPVVAAGGLTGSLQRLTTGETYLAGVGGISITTASNGQVLISGSFDTGGTGGSVDPNVVVMRSG